MFYVDKVGENGKKCIYLYKGAERRWGILHSSETRIRLVHERAEEMQRALDRKKMYRSAVMSCALCIGLIAAVWQLDLRSVMVSGSLLTGSSLLSESAGGYVLVGITAFMLGVIITVVIKKHLDK